MDNGDVRILVIDDDHNIQGFFSDLLNVEGIKLDGALNGRSAIEKAKACKYDISFIDVRLPDINGLETLREIKKIQPDMVCAMISGFFDQAVVAKAITEGAETYLYKPLSLHDIYGVVFHCLQKIESVDLIKNVAQKFGDELVTAIDSI